MSLTELLSSVFAFSGLSQSPSESVAGQESRCNNRLQQSVQTDKFKQVPFAGGVMAFISQEKEILEAAVAGIPRVAEAVASIPEEERAKALEAAETAYRQTVRELGYEEGPAEGWVSTIMLQLRSQLKERISAKQKPPVKSRLDAVSDLGPTELKSIAEPVRVYSLEVGRPVQAKALVPKKRLTLAPLATAALIVFCLLIVGGGGAALFYLKHVQGSKLNPAAETKVPPVEKRTTAVPVDQQYVARPIEQQTTAAPVQQPTSTAPAQTAAAPIQQPNGPSVALDTRRFDGTWIGTLTCNSTPSGLPGWSYELVGNVRNGVLHSQRGQEGEPGSETYDGTIEPDGSAEISQTGFSDDSKMDRFHRPTGTEYRNIYVGSFDELHGKLTRLNQASCTIDFTALAARLGAVQNRLQ